MKIRNTEAYVLAMLLDEDAMLAPWQPPCGHETHPRREPDRSTTMLSCYDPFGPSELVAKNL